MSSFWISGQKREGPGHLNRHPGLVAQEDLVNLAGAGGFEPPASCLEGRRSIRLRYTPSGWSQRMIQARAASLW